MKIFTAIVALPLFICLSPVPVHAPTEPDVAALTTLLHENWSKMAPSSIEKIWSRELKRTEESDVGCAGTVMLSNLPQGRGDCWDCDTFLFDRVPAEGGGCSERLSALTLLRGFPGMSEAVEFGEQLKKVIVGIYPESQAVAFEQGYTITSWPSSTVSQTGRYDVEPSGAGAGVRVRFLIFRTKMAR